MPWLEDTHEAVNALYEEANFLEIKGQNLRSVGMTMLGVELMRCAANIEKACKKISDAKIKELNDQVKKASTMSRTMLEGVLAGITMGKGAEEPTMAKVDGRLCMSCHSALSQVDLDRAEEAEEKSMTSGSSWSHEVLCDKCAEPPQEKE